MHKILADGIFNKISLNKRQKAFVPADGCFENIFLLDTLIKLSRNEKRALNLIVIDLAKAFDSASHCTIDRALKRFNIDSRTRNYILNTYCDSSTIISCEKVTISDVMMTRGVKQGDPLSPILFNMIIDELFDQIRAKLYGGRCNSCYGCNHSQRSIRDR